MEQNGDPWVFIKDITPENTSMRDDTLYVNPSEGTAKVNHYRITYWGYHDESDDEEYDEPISIERAFALVCPDADAYDKIREAMGKDYSSLIEQVEKDFRIESFSNTDFLSYKQSDRSAVFPAVLLDQDGTRTPGELTLTPSRFRFKRNDDVHGTHAVSGLLANSPPLNDWWPYTYNFGHSGRTLPHYAAHPEERILSLHTADGQYFKFNVPQEDLKAFYDFETEFTREMERLTPYRASIACDCIEKKWPHVIHPFFRRREPDGKRINALFEGLLQELSAKTGQPYEQIRRFLYDELPFPSEEVTLKQSKGSLSVSFMHEGCLFRYSETEDGIELRYGDAVCRYPGDAHADR